MALTAVDHFYSLDDYVTHQQLGRLIATAVW